MTNKTHTTVAALIVAAFTTTGTFAGTSNSPVGPDVSLASKSDLTGSLEVNSVSNYTYRGQILDSNPAFTPKLALQAPLFNGGSLQASVEQVVGTKGSTYSRSQYNLGLALTLGKLTVTPGFQIVAFPGEVGKTTQSITGTLAFNDAGFLPLTLNPSVSFSKDVDPKGGTWYEAGIAPSKKLGKFEVSVPVAVGASSNSYYGYVSKDVHYAYASAGVAGTYHATNRLDLKASVTGYTTDSKLSNTSSSNFVSTNVGVAVSF